MIIGAAIVGLTSNREDPEIGHLLKERADADAVWQREYARIEAARERLRVQSEALSDSKSQRARLIRKLGDVLLGEIEPALRSDNLGLRRDALRTLAAGIESGEVADISPVADVVVKGLRDRDVSVRLYCVQIVGRVPCLLEKHVNTVVSFLKDRNELPVVRATAAEVLERGLGHQVSDALLGSLDDADPEVRGRSALSLSVVGPDSRKLIEVLEATARCADLPAQLRARALRVLAEREGGRLESVFRELTRDDSDVVREAAAVALRSCSGSR